MKIRLLFGVLLISSCSILEHTIPGELPASVTNLEEAKAWIDIHIEQRREPEGEDYWQYPKETMERGEGDCEDLAILYLFFATELDGKEEGKELVVIWYNDSVLHAITRIDGRYYDPTHATDSFTSYDVISTYKWYALQSQIELKQEIWYASY